MNLNEVEKHVKFDIIFMLLICIGTLLCFILSIIAIFSPINASASELKTTNITGTIKNTSNCGNQDWNNYCYGQGYYSTTWNKSTFGTGVSSGIEDLAFDLSGITGYSSSPSTIEIYNNTNSFTNKSYYCYFSGSNQPVNCSVSRVSNNRINVNFTTSVGGVPQYLYIHIGTSTGNFDGINGININKVMLLQTIDDPNANVIENANQNTDDIINNNNQNFNTYFSSLFSSMNELFAKVCPNIADWPNGEQNKIIIEAQTDDDWVITDNWIYLTEGVRYYVSFETSCQSVGGSCDGDNYEIFFAYNGAFAHFYNSRNQRFSFVPEYTGNYRLRVDANNDATRVSYWNFMISTTNTNYCPYGSVLESKLDGIDEGINNVNDSIQEVKDLQQDQYNYLTDDSDPTISNSEINNVLGLVSVNDPLSYLLTLPLTLINKINIALNSSCTDYTIGAFEDIGNANLSDYTFTLSCINPSDYLGNSLWTTIDIIMAIGLLVISITKFYHAIMNIITLGAEDKAEKQFKYWSPMEFLCVCLGGGFYDAAWQHNQGGDN